MNAITEDQATSKSSRLNRKQLIAAAIFVFAAVMLTRVVPTIEVAWVSAILLLTIYLFAFEIVGVDVAAASVMVLLVSPRAHNLY